MVFEARAYVDVKNKRVLIIGGSSGIGFATATAAAAAGATVTIASRSSEKLRAASARLSGVDTQVLDVTKEDDVEAFFSRIGPFDHVVVSGSETTFAPVRSLSLSDAYRSMDSKFWGAYRVARAARIADGGSLTFISGFLSVRPRTGAVIQGAINAALESLTRGLALEFAPVRVNCISPGLIATEMYDDLDVDARRALFEGVATSQPVGFVGKPEHVAMQILAFLANPFVTGSTVYVDGGGSIA